MSDKEIKIGLLDANTPHKARDLGETNRMAQSIFEGVYGDNQNSFDRIKQLFVDKYSYDISKNKSGPYLAYVIKVLSGPQANNAATTNSSLTNTAPREDDDPASIARWRRDGSPPIRIIARIPEFDVDIDWPKNNQDQARISSHSEFHALGDPNKSGVAHAREGSTVWVTYHNLENTTGYDGREVGHIIGLHDIGEFYKLDLKVPVEEMLYPECQGSRNLAGPSGGKYNGATIPNPGSTSGPVIKKIKNKIKTGMYGNGTAQTKAHFDAALNKDEISLKYAVHGPAPNSRNAFVWIGHLKHNGYLDFLDRPSSLGRETIIYAPMTLDLDSSIEIKYYFHEAGGFGHSWVHGPETTLELANDVPNGNDFKEKIAPGIKDLIREGRNFILVIPEMAHSRGYGSEFNDTNRTGKMIKGEPTDVGEKAKLITTRTVIGPSTKPLIKTYLKGLQIKGVAENLLQVTHLRQREKASFDGTFTGGNFKIFHEEVLQVLKSHLGITQESIGFTSILADGLGAVSLAAMARAVPDNESHNAAQKDFRNMKINRIDFVDRASQNPPPDMDTKGAYGFAESPSVALYKDYLLWKAESPEIMEFNYITEYKPTSTHPLFSYLKAGQKFKAHNKPAPQPGAQKFSFYVKPGSENTSRAYISFHVAPSDTASRPGAKVGYAFSMVNNFLEDFDGYPLKGDTGVLGRPPQSLVPDHAKAAAAKPGAADTSKYLQDQETSLTKIDYFETLLSDFTSTSSNFCEKYPAFCAKDSKDDKSEARPNTDPSGGLFGAYGGYLEHKKRFKELGLLIEYEGFLAPIATDAEELNNLLDPQGTQSLPASIPTGAKNELDVIQNLIKTGEYRDRWEEHKTHQWFSQMATSIIGSKMTPASAFTENIDIYASHIAEEEALQKLIKKIENAIEEAGPPDVNKQEECPPDGRRPERMGRRIRRQPRLQPALGAKASSSKSLCVGKNIRVVDNYEDLVGMIPYFPKKTYFNYKGKFSTDPTNIRTRIENFEVKKIKYRARAIYNSETYFESPPIWSCISDLISESWNIACNISNYIPFKIINGMSGLPETKKAVTAYKGGIDPSAFGLTIDIDPFITGYSINGDPLHSVFTGAWSPNLVEAYAGELYELGVFDDGWLGPGNTFLDNIYEGSGPELRLSQNYDRAEHAYTGPLFGDGPEIKNTYDEIMDLATGAPIVPRNSNPVLWMLTFCEKSGMKWGNAQFLKRRHRGGNFWSSSEQARIAAIYGISDIVARVNAISWNSNIVENHMRFQYWSGKPLIGWSEIDSVRNKLGK